MVECSEPIEETPRQFQFHDFRDKLAQTNFRRPASPRHPLTPCLLTEFLSSSVFPFSSIKLIGKRDYSLHEFVTRKFIVIFYRLILLVGAEIDLSKTVTQCYSIFVGNPISIACKNDMRIVKGLSIHMRRKVTRKNTM